jgi:hypothetical protein
MCTERNKRILVVGGRYRLLRGVTLQRVSAIRGTAAPLNLERHDSREQRAAWAALRAALGVYSRDHRSRH